MGQRDREGHHGPVHEWHVDLAVFLVRGLPDAHARQPAELHGLTGHRKGAGNDRLAGDDGRECRQQHHRVDRPLWNQAKERIACQRRIIEIKRGLAGIVEQQRRQHDAVPHGTDWIAADMSHVGVQGFTAGDCQERGPEHQGSDARVLQQESQRVGRIDCGKNVRPVQDAANAEHRNGRKPDEHDRPERLADARGAATLHRE